MRYLLLIWFVLVFESLQAQKWSQEFERSYLANCVSQTIRTGSVSNKVATQLCQCTLSKIKQRYPSMASTIGNLNQQELLVINQQCYTDFSGRNSTTKLISNSGFDYYPEIKDWDISGRIAQKFTQKGISAIKLKSVIKREIRFGGKRKAVALFAIASMFDLLEKNNTAGSLLNSYRIITDSEIMNGYNNKDDAIEAIKARKGNYANAAEFERIKEQAYITYRAYFDKIQPRPDTYIITK